MKNFEFKEGVEGMQLMKGIKMSRRIMYQFLLVPTLIFVGMISQTKICLANGTGYAISLTPAIDPVTGNFKVSINSYRGLNAHVVNTPTNTPASGVSVDFRTTRGTLSTTPGTTNSNGDVGTTLWGGWGAGLATVRATVTKDGTDYSDEAIIPVVKPDGQNTVPQGWGRTNYGLPTAGLWEFQLTPTDVNFSALTVTERDGGAVDGGDMCWYSGNIGGYPPFEAVTGAQDSFGSISSDNWVSKPDSVGWAPNQVTDYRNGTGPIPCATHFKQYMDVLRPGEEERNDIYYYSDILGAGISFPGALPGDVSSYKAGQTQYRSWP